MIDRLRYGSVAGRQRLGPGLFIAGVLLFLFLPIVVVVLFSFNESPRLSFPISGLSVRWYEEAFADPFFGTALRNSAIAALATAGLAGALGTIAAFGLMRIRQRGAITTALLLPALAPVLLLGIALNLAVREFGLPLGIRAVVLGHTLIALPFVVLALGCSVVSRSSSAPACAATSPPYCPRVPRRCCCSCAIVCSLRSGTDRRRAREPIPMDNLLTLACRHPHAWAALVALIAMEVVLGIDNLIFIAIVHQ